HVNHKRKRDDVRENDVENAANQGSKYRYFFHSRLVRLTDRALSRARPTHESITDAGEIRSSRPLQRRASARPRVGCCAELASLFRAWWFSTVFGEELPERLID